MGELIGTELDGRLFTDLSTLTPENPVTPADKFFIRTRASKLLDTSSPWTIHVAGLIEKPIAISAEALAKKARPMGIHLMECSGNTRSAHFGMMSVAAWDGVPLQEILQTAKPQKFGVRVLVSGFDRYQEESMTSEARRQLDIQPGPTVFVQSIPRHEDEWPAPPRLIMEHPSAWWFRDGTVVFALNGSTRLILFRMMPQPLLRCRSTPAVRCKWVFLRWRVTTSLQSLISRPCPLASRNGWWAGRSDTTSRGFNGVAWRRAQGMEVRFDPRGEICACGNHSNVPWQELVLLELPVESAGNRKVHHPFAPECGKYRCQKVKFRLL